ncbi:hypothetical protein BDY19DRAFT_903529 [Irpex rosettiformis]|uniref:Uncharacterized protein n=1 Tax=Irpex rosettiformis TaxID=378272 RepID=A0ACB8UF26_9APHY|nr:hypothetical protein BDY19DRAFT_903529 [Irpex rosettiformis]
MNESMPSHAMENEMKAIDLNADICGRLRKGTTWMNLNMKVIFPSHGHLLLFRPCFLEDLKTLGYRLSSTICLKFHIIALQTKFTGNIDICRTGFKVDIDMMDPWVLDFWKWGRRSQVIGCRSTYSAAGFRGTRAHQRNDSFLSSNQPSNFKYQCGTVHYMSRTTTSSVTRLSQRPTRFQVHYGASSLRELRRTESKPRAWARCSGYTIVGTPYHLDRG